MAKNTLIVAGPKLVKKLRDLSNGVTNVDLTTAQKVSNRQEIISRRGTGKNTPAYNGYFAVKDISTYTGDVPSYKVGVFDGGTFNPETGSMYGIAGYVNVEGICNEIYDTEFDVNDIMTEVFLYIYLVPYVDGFELVCSPDLLGYTTNTPNILIAEIQIDEDDRLKIIQRYMGEGINLPDIYEGDFYVDCYYDIENDGKLLAYIHGGKAQINNQVYDLEDLGEDELTQITYVYWHIEYSEDDGTFQNSELRATSNLPTETEDIINRLICTIVPTDNNAARVIYNNYGRLQVFVFGPCEHEAI